MWINRTPLCRHPGLECRDLTVHGQLVIKFHHNGPKHQYEIKPN